MAEKQIEADREHLDVRVTRVEQILPTLATKTDLAAAVASLATKAELAAGLTGLRDELVDRIEGTRTEMRLLYESAKGDTQLLADSVLSLHTKVDALVRNSF